jgi:hypothetical protein
MILGLPDPDPPLVVWIRILPSTSKKRKKNLDLFHLLTSFGFFSLKADVKYLQKVTSKQTFEKNYFFVLQLVSH